LLLGAGGDPPGYQLWVRWGWRRPARLLAAGLILQSLILMGAGLQRFQNWLPFWYGGLLCSAWTFLPGGVGGIAGEVAGLGPGA
jgi:hypothetical protein